MSQVSKRIKVKLEKADNNDYMVFGFDENIKVCLNEESGQQDLKRVFSVLLEELLKTSVELEYEENKEYKVGLYIDVCKEYLNDLNKEIFSVYKKIPEKLKKVDLGK